MTRWAIAVLLLLNWALGAWSFGAFSRWGWAPDDGREPERLARQIKPGDVQLSAVSAPQAPEASAPVAPASAAATPASADTSATPSPR